MIIDKLENAGKYSLLHPKLEQAFTYLQTTDCNSLSDGKYPIDEDNVFAIVQTYMTRDEAGEKMESHKKYIDVQCMIMGEERVGISLLNGQEITSAYDEAADFTLYAGTPSFFARLHEGTFMIFYPTDLHMPCIMTSEPSQVKKVVIKVKL